MFITLISPRCSQALPSFLSLAVHTRGEHGNEANTEGTKSEQGIPNPEVSFETHQLSLWWQRLLSSVTEEVS